MALIKAITFDIYGTLVDTADSSIRATTEMLAERGLDVSPELFYKVWKHASDELRKCKTFHNVRLILSKSLEKTLKEFEIEPEVAKSIDIMFEAIRDRSLYPEAAEVLEKLRDRYVLAVLSSADDDLILPSLQRAGLRFSCVVTSESSGVYKPHPKIFRDCLDLLGCAPQEVLHVGNSQHEDVVGAKDVGMQVAWINRRGDVIRQGLPEPDYEIADLRGLLDILL